MKLRMDYILSILYVICTVAGLLLYKYGATKEFCISLVDGNFTVKLNLISILGLLLYLISFILYIIILPKFNITFILPIVSTATGVLIFVFSIVFLGEPSSIIKWIGFVIMTLGVIIVNFGK